MGRIVCGGLTWLKLQLKGVLRARDKVAKERCMEAYERNETG